MNRPKMFAVLPTLLTLGNAACGFGSITFAAKVGPEPEWTGGNDLFIAGLLIFVAMVFDMFDGYAARRTQQTSEFGAELDSLCDAISFGIAPAFLMVQFCRHDHGVVDPQHFFDFHPRLLWVVALLMVWCALLRLARFNVETDEDDSHEFFSGLPSPAAAGTVASFPISMRGLKNLIEGDVDTAAETMATWLAPVLEISLPFVTFAVACLMVSKIRYVHYFNQLFRGKRNRQHVIQLVFTMAAVFLVREVVLLLIFGYFAFGAPLRAFWTEIVQRRLYKSRGI